jgi:hypothetical protein
MLTINGKVDGFTGIDKVYIGRFNKHYGLKQSALQNPYIISKTLTREQSIEHYKRRIIRSIKALQKEKHPDLIMTELIRIIRLERKLNKENNQVKLSCYCKPLACHGDVIITAINWLMKQDWFNKYIS